MPFDYSPNRSAAVAVTGVALVLCYAALTIGVLAGVAAISLAWLRP